MCYVEELLKLTIFGVGITYAGSLMAKDEILVYESGKFNWMQPYNVSDNQEQNAFREQVQMRMRNLSQQEQKLMRETGFNGRDRISTVDHDRSGEHSNFGSDSTYGRGFESRQLQQNGSDAIGGGFSTGRASGGGGNQGRGR